MYIYRYVYIYIYTHICMYVLELKQKSLKKDGVELFKFHTSQMSLSANIRHTRLQHVLPGFANAKINVNAIWMEGNKAIIHFQFPAAESQSTSWDQDQVGVQVPDDWHPISQSRNSIPQWFISFWIIYKTLNTTKKLSLYVSQLLVSIIPSCVFFANPNRGWMTISNIQSLEHTSLGEKRLSNGDHSQCCAATTDAFGQMRSLVPAHCPGMHHMHHRFSSQELILEEVEHVFCALWFHSPKNRWILWMEEILHQLIGGLSHYL